MAKAKKDLQLDLAGQLIDAALAAAEERAVGMRSRRVQTLRDTYARVLGRPADKELEVDPELEGTTGSPIGRVGPLEFTLEPTSVFDPANPTYEPNMLVLRRFEGRPVDTSHTRARGAAIRSLADLGAVLQRQMKGDNK